MFCRQCGAQVDDNDKFCVNCGFKLQEENINEKEDTLENLEKDFSNLENKMDSIFTAPNTDREYLRKKWVTLLLFCFPYTSFLGIHHFYNKRHLRGALYILLDMLMGILYIYIGIVFFHINFCFRCYFVFFHNRFNMDY